MNSFSIFLKKETKGKKRKKLLDVNFVSCQQNFVSLVDANLCNIMKYFFYMSSTSQINSLLIQVKWK